MVEAHIETPRWSFTKYRWDGKGHVPILKSPLPTIFNYGFVEGLTAGDGDPRDAIVLGAPIEQGQSIDFPVRGLAAFFDKGREDGKLILSQKPLSLADRMMINAFFIVYAIFKTVRGVFFGRLSLCLWGGIRPHHQDL